jgi:hypothetical protein
LAADKKAVFLCGGAEEEREKQMTKERSFELNYY